MRGYLEDLKTGGRPMTDKELADHYKHLYSEVKKQKDDLEKENNELQKAYELIDKSMYELMKQKDDVIEYIKNNFIEGEVFYSKLWLKMKKKDLLRMLGEIDD